MRRLSLVLVSTVCSMLAGQSGVAAGSMTPADVTSMLAKSHAIDIRCNILSETDRQDLMDYLARAEILLAERDSVKAARSAIAKGKAAGTEAACGPEQDKFIGSILSAARASTVAEPPVQQATEPPAAEQQPLPPKQIEASLTAVPKPRQSVVEAEPKPVAARKATVVAEVKIKPNKKKLAQTKPVVAALQTKLKPQAVASVAKKKPPTSLNTYAGVAQRYYVELKCRSMSGSAVKRLYATVLAKHKQAVAENGPSAVRTVLRSAEAQAKSRNC